MKHILTLATLVFATACFGQLPDYVPTEGLVAWYPFNGNASDQSVGGFDAENHGATLTSDRHGIEEAAFYFDGNSWIESVIPQTEAWSVSIWASREDGDSYNGLVQHKNNCNNGGGWLLALPEQQGLRMYRSGCGECGSSCSAQLDDTAENLVAVQEWNHLVATCNAQGHFQAFVDGVLAYEWTHPSSVSTYGVQPFSVGIHHDGYTYLPLTGSADDVGLWNRPLAPSEVLSLFNAPAPVVGCTEIGACNYAPEATFDDGSCVEFDACGDCGGEGVAGCIDESACNFDSAASCDDGGCVYPPFIDLGEDIDTCEEVIVLHAGEGHANYAWSTGATSESIAVDQSGLYEVTVGGEYNSNSNSLSFDGADDYMDIPDIGPELYTEAFTFMAHAFLEDVTATDFYNILSTDDNSAGNMFQWGCRPGTLIQELHSSNSSGSVTVYSSDSPITNNEWHHIAISFDGGQPGSTTGELRFYMDGVASGVHSADIDVAASLTLVGHYLLNNPDNLGAREPWSGGLDDMQIWSLALSESDILDYMNCPPPQGANGLVAHWSFDEGQGDSVVDLSGNGFHGTLVNGTAWNEEIPSMVCAQQCLSSDSILVELFDYECLCGDGTTWDESSGECVSVLSPQNACGQGTEWHPESQTCVISNPSDTDFDGCVSMTDLLDLLTVFGTCNEVPWSCGDLLEYQGYDYETVQIGEQCWFAENLQGENYKNGDAIPAGLSDDEWSTTSSGALVVYGEGSSSCNTHSPDGDACDPSWSLVEYGRLYNWYAVSDERGLCPMGWHVPTDAEFSTMTDGFGGNEIAGNHMKTTFGWDGNGNGTNSSGFSGLPGGYRANNGDFTEAGSNGYWWSSSPIASDAWGRYLLSANESIYRYQNELQDGFSVRCIQDSE